MGIVNFDMSQLDRILHSAGGPVGRYCNNLARAIAAEAGNMARSELQIRTGKYSGGFQVKVRRLSSSPWFEYRVVNNVVGDKPKRTSSYAGVMEKGGRPHTIRVRDPKRFLVFWVDGRKIITKSVQHPGSEAHNILTRASQKVMSRVS